MNSLVLDFENKVNDNKYSITDLLRHCLIIARKLKQQEFVEWIYNELNGYENKEVPSYRKIPLNIKFLNPYYGWCPYVVTQKEVCDNLSHMPIKITISEIEETTREKDNDIIRFSVPGELKKSLINTVEFETDFCYEGSRISMIKIIDAVKNEMLNWILSLEENGIIDENNKFNNNQIKKANKVTSQIINNFYGDKNSIDLSQIINK
ncbi:MAG: hypothetical protein IJK67_04735 [Bacilli bacterium]|nr:hypothetical protein [Bacilli bacterium]